MTLISPDRQRDIIRSLIDIYRHTGYMPDAVRRGNNNGRTQGGSNANVVIADAYVKGLKGIDYETALAAMVHDAEVAPANAQKEGRGGLKDYNEKGYITLADERSGSRIVEYSYDDFAISEVACGLGKPKEATLYASRAHNFEHLWDKDMTVEALRAFFDRAILTVAGPLPTSSSVAPGPTSSMRAISGPTPSMLHRTCDDFIEFAGGNETFVRRLDSIFLRAATSMSPTNPASSFPCSTTTQAVQIRPPTSFFFYSKRLSATLTPASQATMIPEPCRVRLIFSTLGLFPVAGQDIYLISTPSIPDASLTLGNGKKLRVVARNLDHNGLNRYVQSATLERIDLPNASFRHAQIMDGATLVLTMGSAPSGWGRSTPPPSMNDPSAHLCSGDLQSSTNF